MATLSGRLVNFTVKHFPSLGERGTRRQVKQYRESQGTKGAKLMGKPVFLLDVIGRKSGESRPVMLMLAWRGDDLLVTGSRGGHPETPNWYKNLMAAGEAEVQVGADTWSVTARELPEGAEREECWRLLVEAYPDFASYQELTDRRLPVAVLSRVADCRGRRETDTAEREGAGERHGQHRPALRRARGPAPVVDGGAGSRAGATHRRRAGRPCCRVVVRRRGTARGGGRCVLGLGLPTARVGRVSTH